MTPAGEATPSPATPSLAIPSLATARVSYTLDGLVEDDLAAAPLEQLERWYAEVAASGAVVEPNALVLATVDADGLPDARTVLLKGMDARGLVFYSNHGSAKGRQLAAAPVAALVLPWHALQRQVRVRGRVERVPEAESAAYSASRPWGSRIGAWASHQSEVAGGRGDLEEAWARCAARWPEDGSGGEVPLPPFWGGYLVRPVEVELWVGRTSRMHDRLVYLPADGPEDGPGDSTVRSRATPPLDDPTGWRVERRQP